MLPRHERRRLEEIENGLNAEDPEFARRLTDPRIFRWVPRRASAPVVCAIAAAVSAVLCLFLGEGTGFVVAASLAVVLIALRNWQFRAE